MFPERDAELKKLETLNVNERKNLHQLNNMNERAITEQNRKVEKLRVPKGKEEELELVDITNQTLVAKLGKEQKELKMLPERDAELKQHEMLSKNERENLEQLNNVDLKIIGLKRKNDAEDGSTSRKAVKTAESKNRDVDFITGTTVMSLIFKDGIIMASDSKGSDLLGNVHDAKKIKGITGASIIAGGAGKYQHSQLKIKQLQTLCDYSRRGGGPPLTFEEASDWLQSLMDGSTRAERYHTVVIGGFKANRATLQKFEYGNGGDEEKMYEGDFLALGTGKEGALECLNETISNDGVRLLEMNLEQATELVKRLILYSKLRDKYTGNKLYVYCLHKATGLCETMVNGVEINHLLNTDYLYLRQEYEVEKKNEEARAAAEGRVPAKSGKQD